MDGNAPASLSAVRALGAGIRRVGRRPGRTALRSDVLTLAFDALAVWDVVAVALTAGGSAVLYAAVLHPFPDSFNTAQLAGGGALLAPAVLRSRHARDAFDAFAASDLVSATCQRLTLWVALMLAVVFLTHSGGEFPRAWMSLWLAASFAAVLAGRVLAVAALRAASERGRLRDRVAVLGGGPAFDRLVRRLRAPGRAGVELAGAFDVSHGTGPHGNGTGLDHAVATLIAMGSRGEVDRVVVALPAEAESSVLGIVLRLKALDVEVSQCPPLAGLLGEAAQATLVGGAPMLVLASRPFEGGGLLMKSLFDRLVALLAIAFLAPLLALLAVAVRLDSPGPALFRQPRHGWNNTEFQVFKFRTMGAANVTDGAVQTRRRDARVTRVGRFLRHTSMDELPQLFNVLNGTMSLVGPRPHPVVMRTEDRLGEEIVAEYSHRHRVKPGITGWAQIHGHRGATETAEQVRARVACDLYYIDNWSFLLDLRILVLTPFKIVFQRTNAF